MIRRPAPRGGCCIACTDFRSRQPVSQPLNSPLILPVMLMLYLGMAEVTQGVNINRKLTVLSRTVADITSRASDGIDNSEMDDIFAAALSVMAPYDASQVSIRLTSVVVRDVDGDAVGEVCLERRPSDHGAPDRCHRHPCRRVSMPWTVPSSSPRWPAPTGPPSATRFPARSTFRKIRPGRCATWPRCREAA